MNQGLFYLVERRVSELNAFAKAPADIIVAAERLGFRACEFCQGLLGRILVGPRVHWPWVKVLLARLRLRSQLPNGSVCLYQYPNFSLRNEVFVDILKALRKRRIKLICIVHDIEEMRFRNSDTLLESTRQLLSLFDVLIVHNASMRKMLAAKGLPEDRMIDLGVFDYLSNPIPPRQSEGGRRIVIAGNLDPKKAGYLSGLKDLRDVEWRLYGSNLGEGVLQGEHIKHCGSHPPEDLPAKIEGDYGLVWDGDSIETCSGLLGRYLRYNNPHKFSLYLRAGLPVIVWKESAIAAFVEKHGVGLTVASLSEIGTALSRISSETYRQMQENCQMLSSRIGAGRYSEYAIRTAIERVGGNRGNGES